mmetsp:Transcript_27803/g.50675  ORF Transcript_27803/g.50675 Transcript_27803/m.50675 type:complete len:373 (-) Transcript_27803:66-1184(-)
MLHQIDNTAGVTPLVIVPGDKLDEVGVKHDTGTGIKDRRTAIGFEVSRNKGLVTVSKNSLHLALRLGLDGGADMFVSGGRSKSTGKINNRHVNSGDTESHAGELALKTGDDLGHGLGGTSGRGDDVARGSTSSTPVLAGRGVNNSLGGSHGVYGGHECLSDFVLIMDGLDHGGKSVGGAGCARDEVLGTVVLVGVDTHDNSLGVILSGGRVDDLLGTSINDGLGGLLGEEDTGGFAHVVSSEGTPADLLGVTAAGSLDLLAVEDKEVSIDLDSSLGNSVDGIVLVLVRHVISRGGTGVDTVELDIIVLHHDTGHETSDTSESVDSHAGSHGHGGSIGGGLKGGSREGVGVGGASGGEGKGSGELHCWSWWLG